jgi:hypothetical protein
VFADFTMGYEFDALVDVLAVDDVLLLEYDAIPELI